MSRGGASWKWYFRKGNPAAVPIPGSSIFTFINTYSCPGWKINASNKWRWWIRPVASLGQSLNYLLDFYLITQFGACLWWVVHSLMQLLFLTALLSLHAKMVNVVLKWLHGEPLCPSGYNSIYVWSETSHASIHGSTDCSARCHSAIPLCALCHWHITFFSNLKAIKVMHKVSYPEKIQYCFCFECLLPLRKTLD